MPRLMKVPIKEATGHRKKVVRKAKKLNQYMKYINELAPNEAGKFKIKDNKEYFAIRANIKRAAKVLGVNVKVQKREDYIYFWKIQES